MILSKKAMKFVFLTTFLLSTFLGVSQNYEEGVLSTKEVDLYYRVYGSGAPLLVLNGGPGFPCHHFDFLAEKLSEQRQVILFDQRGTGFSRLRIDQDSMITVRKMVQDIEALRKHLKISEWKVFGHSWGGMYGMAYVKQYPERVKALILSHSGGINLEFSEVIEANIRAKLHPEKIEQLDYYTAHPSLEEASIKRVEAMASAYVYDQSKVDLVIKGLTEGNPFRPRINRLVWNNLRETGWDLRADMASLELPVLVIGGYQDILGDHTPHVIAASFPNSSLVMLNECAHYGWLDQPKQYFAAINSFLEALVH